jgi:hypothetical protein
MLEVQIADLVEEWAPHRAEEAIADKAVEVVWDAINSSSEYKSYPNT